MDLITIASEQTTDVAEAVDRAREYFDSAHARNTRSTYAAGWRAFETWGGTLPASPATVALFATHLAQRGQKVSTIRTRLAAIAAVHRDHGFDDPSKDEAVRRVLTGIARQHGTRPAQARGLTETDVARIEATTSTHPRDLRDLAMLLTARDLLARRSELVALDVADVELHPDGGTAVIQRSKTDPQGVGHVGYLGPRTVSAIRAWLAVRGAFSGPLFATLSRCNRLHAGTVHRRFRRMAERAGIDPSRVSGHSARVGMAQDLAADGASLVELQQAGRWSSPTMPARYAEKQHAQRGAVARFHARREA